MKDSKAQVIKIKDLPKIRYPIPESMIKAAGLMRHKKGAGRTLRTSPQ